jgi:2-amino-4-hydroxy-6-hydroxymethyldihydropteridine diphosphokinase
MTLAAAVSALAVLPGAHLRGVSHLYITRPVGDLDQPDFHNAVVALDAPAGPDPETGALALLLALKGLEAAFGRRPRGRWGPRELDLDLLIFGRHRIHAMRPPAGRSADPTHPMAQWLEVPHLDAANRLFVLAPLADLVPHLVPPGWHARVATLRDARQAAEGRGAARPVATWDPVRRHWVPYAPR